MSALEMIEAAIVALLVFTAIEQAVAVAIFLAYCRRRPRAVAEDELPEVLVVLALRGRDASLGDCLIALSRPCLSICRQRRSRIVALRRNL